MIDTLGVSDFEPLLNSTLQMSFGADVAFPVVLVQVNHVPTKSPLERQPFSILVRSEQKTHYYHQTMFTLSHPSKGDLDIFFVPIGFDGQGVLYEAVFS